MSEKKMEVELKAEDRELLKSTIKKVDEFLVIKVEPKEKEHKHEEATPKHEHFKVETSYLEQADACPECKKGLEDFGKAYMKNLKESRESKPMVCETCGLGVDADEEACPWCGGEDAKER